MDPNQTAALLDKIANALQAIGPEVVRQYQNRAIAVAVGLGVIAVALLAFGIRLVRMGRKLDIDDDAGLAHKAGGAAFICLVGLVAVGVAVWLGDAVGPMASLAQDLLRRK